MLVVKRNKRLWVIDRQGALVYTPPDFIRLQSREPLNALAADLEWRPYIEAVMDFERTARRTQRAGYIEVTEVYGEGIR